ncbi:hypothetical protein AMJ86_05120 [bacterium SM23_57]|nr:MAG: hypothetical protein AMJ86_05120 [bacterium SM23_57]
MGVLLIRADAYAGIGIGHVMRCIALAQAWQEIDGKCVFASALISPDLTARLKSEHIDVEHISATPGSEDDALLLRELANTCNAEWIAVDGYAFGADYQHIVKKTGLPVLFFDDNGHAEYYFADIVLNQNLHADKSLYSDKEPYTKLLLGPEYVLLRRDFLQWREWKRSIPTVGKKVLVTMGGGDPYNVTLKVIRALQDIKLAGFEVRAVVGITHPYLGVVQTEAKQAQIPIQLIQNPENMPGLMAWADLAVSAGGTTCWELAFMGLPAVLIITAENQVKSTSMLQRKGLFQDLGWFKNIENWQLSDAVITLLFDDIKRQSYSEILRKSVDGLGSSRVVEAMIRSKKRILVS